MHKAAPSFYRFRQIPFVFRLLVSPEGLARVSLSTLRPWSLSTSHVLSKSQEIRAGLVPAISQGMRIGIIMTRQKNAPIVTWFTASALLISVCAGLVFNQPTAAQSNESGQSASQRNSRGQAASDYPNLQKYASDLTQLALGGKLEPARGRDADIARLIESLGRTTSKAPVVVGEFDLDRNAIARGLAFRIAFGDVPESLRNKHVLSLSLDALAKDAGTSDEFASRVQSVFAEAAQADGQIVLFVDQLHQYAGERATTVVSAAVQVAIEANHVRMIGGTSPEAYAEYIASDESLAKLFETISIDRPGENAITADTAENKDAKRLGESSKGDKISPDLRELINGAASGRDRISVILQTDDLGNADLRKLLSRNGVLISASMAQIGMMTVEMPARSIALVAANRKVSYLSSNREIRTLGHLETTTGAADDRSKVTVSAKSYTLHGTGITIAALVSGMDTGHKTLTSLSNNSNSSVI